MKLLNLGPKNVLHLFISERALLLLFEFVVVFDHHESLVLPLLPVGGAGVRVHALLAPGELATPLPSLLHTMHKKDKSDEANQKLNSSARAGITTLQIPKIMAKVFTCESTTKLIPLQLNINLSATTIICVHNTVGKEGGG